MKLIENINSLLRFIGYLIPLILLLFSRGIIFEYINKLRWYHQNLWQFLLKMTYYGLILIAALFATIAIFKLLKYGNDKRYKHCYKQLTSESKVRIARLAELDSQVEKYFTLNSEWLEKDIENFIEAYSREVGKTDYNEFKYFVNERALIYFSHRVSQRNQFLNILNRL